MPRPLSLNSDASPHRVDVLERDAREEPVLASRDEALEESLSLRDADDVWTDVEAEAEESRPKGQAEPLNAFELRLQEFLERRSARASTVDLESEDVEVEMEPEEPRLPPRRTRPLSVEELEQLRAISYPEAPAGAEPRRPRLQSLAIDAAHHQGRTPPRRIRSTRQDAEWVDWFGPEVQLREDSLIRRVAVPVAALALLLTCGAVGAMFLMAPIDQPPAVLASAETGSEGTTLAAAHSMGAPALDAVLAEPGEATSIAEPTPLLAGLPPLAADGDAADPSAAFPDTPGSGGTTWLAPRAAAAGFLPTERRFAAAEPPAPVAPPSPTAPMVLAGSSTLEPSAAAPLPVPEAPLPPQALADPLEDSSFQPQPEAIEPEWSMVPGEQAASTAPAFEGPDVPLETALVTTDVNLRASAAKDGSVMTVVPAKSIVEVISCDTWCEVMHEGQQGFIYSDFIDQSAAVAVARE